MKSNLLLSMLMIIPGVLLPAAARCQVAPDRPPAEEQPERTFKYEGYIGYAYTSLNQVNQSRFGLQGVNASVTRDWGKYFGLTLDGADYVRPLRGGTSVNSSGNPVDAKVDLLLAGPVLHVDLFFHLSGFVRALIGGAHTGGAGEVPNISFAGGVGGGMEYQLTHNISLRASGDNIISSFVEDPNHLGYTPLRRGEPRAAFGAVYKF